MDAMSVLMVDANPTFLRIATRVLREYYPDELTVVGMSHGGDDAFCQVSTLKPHVLLLGFEDRSDDTLRSIHRLRAAVPGVRIIVVGPLDMPAYHQAALEAGADGFLARTALNDARALLPLLRQAPHTATAANERETVGARLSALTLACL